MTGKAAKAVKNWWLLLIAGLLSIAAGIAVFCFPADSYYVFSIMFGVIMLGTGVGSGIISAGRLLPDANCGSGEFGEVRIGGVAVKFVDAVGRGGIETLQAHSWQAYSLKVREPPPEQDRSPFFRRGVKQGSRSEIVVWGEQAI